MCRAITVLIGTAPATMKPAPGPGPQPYRAPSSKTLTQLLCMDAPSAMIVAPHT